MINPPIYRLTTAVSDIDQTNINRDIRDGNWLSIFCICLCHLNKNDLLTYLLDTDIHVLGKVIKKLLGK